jgi:type IV pilus assembly protein PilB
LEGILAQRLVRRICKNCRTEFQPSAEMLMELNMRPPDAQGKKFYYGAGCELCNNTGHKGRLAIFEMIVMNDDLRDLISSGSSTDKLRMAIRQQKVSNLREAGLRAIYSGLTTIEEVVRETVLEDDA